MNRIVTAGITGVALALSASTQAATINEVVAHDTTLNARADLAGSNDGSSDRAIVGGTTTSNDFSAPIFRWTLSTVPTGETAITDGTATFTVYPFADHSSSVGQVVNVYLIGAANAGWLEGDGGDPTGEATWNNLAHPSTSWVGGAGLGSPGGGGYGATPLDSFTFNNQSSIELTIPQAVLSDWIANPADNAGIIMFMQGMDGTERFLRFWSNQGSSPAVLSFETAVPEPGALLSLAVGGLLFGRRRHCD